MNSHKLESLFILAYFGSVPLLAAAELPLAASSAAPGAAHIQPAPSAVLEQKALDPAIVREPEPTPAPRAEPTLTLQTEADASPSTPATTPAATQNTRQKKPAPKADSALNVAIALADTQFKEKNYALVMQTLQAHEAAIFHARERGAARLFGWAAYHSADWTRARLWFTRAANWSNQDEDLGNIVRVELAEQHFERAQTLLQRLPASEEWDALRVQALQAGALRAFERNDYPQASKQLNAAKGLAELDAGNLELLGWSEYHQNRFLPASLAFEQSYRLYPSSGAAQGLVYSLYALNNLAKAYALSDELNATLGSANAPLGRLLADDKARQRVLDSPPERAQARVMLDAEARIVPSIYQAETRFSHARIEVFAQDNNIPFNQGRFSLSGLAADFMFASERERLELRASAFNADDGQQRVDGLSEFFARYRHYNNDGLETTLGLGSTPQGGLISPTLSGELGLGWLQESHGGRIKLFRQSVQQSVLSMSGFTQANRDGTLTTWGRVVSNGLNLQGYQHMGRWKAEGSLSLAELSGQGVADNRMAELYANALHPLEDDGSAGWHVGPLIFATSYQHNLSPFTPGNGGYYSPESLLRLAALLRYQKKWDGLGAGWNIELNASLGWQASNEAAASSQPLNAVVFFDLPASRNRGLAATFDVDLFYAANTHWRYGLLLSAQESPSYSYTRGQLYFSYLW